MNNKFGKLARAQSLLSAALLLGALSALTPNAHAQGGMPLWTNRYNGPGNSDDGANAVAVNSSGDVFVTGHSTDTNGYEIYATVAYSGAGVALWTNLYHGPGNGNDMASAVAVDSSGRVFVAGHSTGTDGYYDCATVAYSNEGMSLWTNRYNGPGNFMDYANTVALGSSGEVFVAGNSTGISTGFDYATVAYSNAGLPLWTNRYDGPGHVTDVAQAAAVDGTGRVLVSGYSSGSIGRYDYATVAYSSAGLPLWTNRYHGPGSGDDVANAVAVDEVSGNVFVTGGSYATNGYLDYATVAYSGAGLPLWTNRYNGPGNKHDAANALAVDNSGNIFVTGTSDSGGGNYGYLTVAYSGSGVPLWTNRYNGPGNGYDNAYAVAVDSSGNVFVTGQSAAIDGYADCATVAYSGAGLPLWINRYNGPGNGYDYAYAISVDRGGNVLVTGRSDGGGGNYDYVTIKYSSSVPPVHLDFQRLENQLVLSWTNSGFNLQSAPAIGATFTNIPGAISPYTNPISGPQLFFRLQGK
jgi:hypothetical protein